MMTEKEKVPEDGITADGYICDQDCFSSVCYRTMHADVNGCGWIAAYNLRHYLGQNPDWREVLQEMDRMHTMRFPGPTLMRILRDYLKKYVPAVRETSGQDAAVKVAAKSSAGIFRYHEGHVPHFIMFFRTGEDRFRFFNVADGLEDYETSMSQFAAEHFRRGQIIALTVTEEDLANYT